MTLMKTLLFTLIVIPSLSWGALGLPPAEELKAKAGLGRTELREVILDIDNNIQEMGYPEIFDSYFYLLDDLQELAIKFNLDEIYPGAVETLGAHMTDSGIRWLSISDATHERLLYYHKWMNLDVTIRYMDQTEVEINALKNMDKVRAASENVAIILTYVESRYPRYYHLLSGYRRIMSNIALKFLRQPGLADDDVLHWIGKLRSPAGYSDYLVLLSTEIYAVKAEAKEILHTYAERLKALHATIESDGSDVPETIFKNLGDATTDLILRSLRLEEPFRAGELGSLLQLLSIGQLHDLASRWNSAKQLPSDAFITKYFEASKDFVAHLRAIGMAKEVADINSWVGMMGAPAMARLLEVEGRYDLKDNGGDSYKMIILKSSELQLQALMWKQGDAEAKYFQTIRWDFENSNFVASERVMDLTDFSAPSLVKFKASQGQIEFFNPFGDAESQSMKGSMAEVFPDLMKDPAQANYEGFYQGTVQFADGKESAVQLTVSAIGSHYVGRIYGKSLDASFDLGSQTDGAALYLTTSQQNHLKDFAHLRLKKTASGLTGLLILADQTSAILSLK